MAANAMQMWEEPEFTAAAGNVSLCGHGGSQPGQCSTSKKRIAL